MDNPMGVSPVPLDALDDTQPAGPYEHELDECGLRLLCLAAIRQAVLDTKRTDEISLLAQIWLSETAKVWLKALGIARYWKDPHVQQLIYGDCQYQSLNLLEEDWNDR